MAINIVALSPALCYVWISQRTHNIPVTAGIEDVTDN